MLALHLLDRHPLHHQGHRHQRHLLLCQALYPIVVTRAALSVALVPFKLVSLALTALAVHVYRLCLAPDLGHAVLAAMSHRLAICQEPTRIVIRLIAAMEMGIAYIAATVVCQVAPSPLAATIEGLDAFAQNS